MHTIQTLYDWNIRYVFFARLRTKINHQVFLQPHTNHKENLQMGKQYHPNDSTDNQPSNTQQSCDNEGYKWETTPERISSGALYFLFKSSKTRRHSNHWKGKPNKQEHAGKSLKQKQ